MGSMPAGFRRRCRRRRESRPAAPRMRVYSPDPKRRYRTGGYLALQHLAQLARELRGIALEAAVGARKDDRLAAQLPRQLEPAVVGHLAARLGADAADDPARRVPQRFEDRKSVV